jgi:single-stranded-DNA-specific exonuclease
MPIPFLWERLTCNDEAAAVLARELKISPAIARLLAIRGIDEPESAQRFLRPSLDHLHDPFRLAGMAPAVERIFGAIERKERIAIHGDYDCDGITSTVILRRALVVGANVVTSPDRSRRLRPSPRPDRLQADGGRSPFPSTAAFAIGQRSAHASCRSISPYGSPRARCGTAVAVAVINPRRHDCDYPDKNLPASAWP